MDTIVNALSIIFQWQVIIFMLIGVVAGIVVGALPGFGPSMGIALLLPVTFGMNPTTALLMLTAMYTSAVYGGSIPAILCHTPGTAASAATSMDGYILTQQGRGLEAVGISTISSMIGGSFGALALILIAPPLGRFAMRFSALEYFMLGIFGLTIIGSVSGDSMVKGLLSGVLGLLIGTIGLDYITGVPRFTFGIINLEDGLNFVPALIGLFSVSQVLILSIDIAKKRKSISLEGNLLGHTIPTFKKFKSIFHVILKSGIIGTIVGIIPAAGASISSWVCYGFAKQLSKTPEKFGKGSIEGIAASESGNNAATGGALIPLFTLGIPGSPVTAILLGGLMIHGLNPGADMYTKHATLTFCISFGFLLANILMGLVGLVIARQVARISTIPPGILCAGIIVLAMIGSFAIRNSLFDVMVMVIFGLIGYIMRISGFATAPMVLGMVLSNLVESNWRRALILAKGNIFTYFLGRPVSLVLLVLVLISFFMPFILKYVSKKTIINEAE